MAQTDVWNVGREGDTVVANFGDLRLSGDIKADHACHSLVITGSFGRQVAGNSGPDVIALTLYIDGRELDSKEIEATFSVEDQTIATRIGDPDRQAQGDALQPPVILNKLLSADTPWTIDAFSQELCSDG